MLFKKKVHFQFRINALNINWGFHIYRSIFSIVFLSLKSHSHFSSNSSVGGGPTQIEYLELENRLDQKVALRVLYDGRPTTTIAVGDPLTFRLEPQSGFSLVSDIFATNVVARDPYSGRAVQLIDSRGWELMYLYTKNTFATAFRNHHLASLLIYRCLITIVWSTHRTKLSPIIVILMTNN